MTTNNYSVSPIQNIGGLITTERSGLGKWGEQSKRGMIKFCKHARHLLGEGIRCAEIGSYAGEMTIALGMIAKEVHAIDPWKNGYDPDDNSSEAFPMEEVEHSFDIRVKGFTNIKKYKSTEEQVCARGANQYYHLVYIDSIHKLGPCKDQIKRWLPKICIGGYIAGHDFCGYWGEVVDAVLETIGVPNIVFEDGSWMKKVEDNYDF